MHYLYCSIMGYLFGSINPAYIISKIKGFDIREKGSGNAGASNTAMVIGKKAALVVALFDIFKAYIAVIIASSLFPPNILQNSKTKKPRILLPPPRVAYLIASAMPPFPKREGLRRFCNSASIYSASSESLHLISTIFIHLTVC